VSLEAVEIKTLTHREGRLETQEEDAIYKLRRESSEEARPAHKLDLGLLGS